MILNRIHPAPEGDESAGGSTWDSPVEGETAKGETAETPAKAETPEEKPKPAEETPASGQPAETETPAAAATAETTPKIDLDGVEYTLDELREFRKGAMLERDYTRKTMRLAEERKALEDERRAFLASRATPPEREPGKAEDADLDDPEIPDPVRKILKEERKERMSLRAELDRREKEQDRRVFEERTWETFDRTFEACCKKNDITDPLEKELIHAAILRTDPDFDDFDDLASKVEKVFDEKHRGLQSRIAKAVEAKLAGLKKAPVVPSPKGGATVPAKGPAKPEPKGFDVEPSVEEFEAILAEQRRAGGL